MVFALFNVIWSTLFLEEWKRRGAELAYKWGTLDSPGEAVEEPRPQFRVSLGLRLDFQRDSKGEDCCVGEGYLCVLGGSLGYARQRQRSVWAEGGFRCEGRKVDLRFEKGASRSVSCERKDVAEGNWASRVRKWV